MSLVSCLFLPTIRYYHWGSLIVLSETLGSHAKHPLRSKENLLIMFLPSRHQVLACSSLVVSLFTLSACMNPGQPPAPPLPSLAKPAPFTAVDTGLATKLNDADLTHIALANLAKTHAARNDIALLSTTIVKDLTDNHDKLTALATTGTVTLPAKPSAQSQKVIDQMQRLHGAAFDRAYARYLASSTKTTSTVIDADSATSTNADLVKLATDLKTKLLGYEAQVK